MTLITVALETQRKREEIITKAEDLMPHLTQGHQGGCCCKPCALLRAILALRSLEQVHGRQEDYP